MNIKWKKKPQTFAKAPEIPQPADHEFLIHVLENKCNIIYLVKINQISKSKQRESSIFLTLHY